ncbi:MAG: hypothetical protein IKV97_00605 [Clostridia bacterium]|nr:hypothetical protein [Clostridia bacterium]
MKKPMYFVIYICLSLSACLAAQYFCARETQELLRNVFGKGAHVASALITGADRLGFLFYGIFLYGAAADCDYEVKYFCNFSLAAAFLNRMCVFGTAAVSDILSTFLFFAFFAVAFHYSVSLRKKTSFAALPAAAMSLLLCSLRFL